MGQRDLTRNYWWPRVSNKGSVGTPRILKTGFMATGNSTRKIDGHRYITRERNDS
jgi:hypothetical protein